MYTYINTSLSPIRHGFAPGFVNYEKECTRLAAASDKVYQLLANGRWFSPASSTTKTGRHDIAEILLKVALNTINQSINILLNLIVHKLNLEIHERASVLKFTRWITKMKSNELYCDAVQCTCTVKPALEGTSIYQWDI
jgi:hypothetical protein